MMRRGKSSPRCRGRLLQKKPLDSHLVRSAIESADRHAIRLFALSMCRVPGSNDVFKRKVAAQIVEEGLNFGVHCRRLCEWHDLSNVKLSPDPWAHQNGRPNSPAKLIDALNYLVHSRSCKIAYLTDNSGRSNFPDGPNLDCVAAYFKVVTDNKEKASIPIISLAWTYMTSVCDAISAQNKN